MGDGLIFLKSSAFSLLYSKCLSNEPTFGLISLDSNFKLVASPLQVQKLSWEGEKLHAVVRKCKNERFLIVVWFPGVVIFIIAFFGCIGAWRENACMVYTYAVCLIVILIGNFSSKGQCHEIFDFRFFSWIRFPPAPEYSIRTISDFFVVESTFR
jgi:hypothetical protein